MDTRLPAYCHEDKPPRGYQTIAAGDGVIVGEVWGVAEIVEYLSLSRQRVTVLVNRPDFPQPVQVLATGRIWRAGEVREWAKQ